MKIPGPLISARFLSRPNRFITLVNIEGNIVKSHLADPGRLKELLIKDAKLYLSAKPHGSLRKTDYSTILIEHAGQLISLVTTLPNRFVLESFKDNSIPVLKQFTLIKPEIKYERHRFDFLLKDKMGNPFYLEVKSVTFVDQGVAKFPDAVTARGWSHVKTLTSMAEAGIGAGILFVCQRDDAKEFRPMWERDPKFAQALLNAKNSGVKVWCITTSITKTEMTISAEIPVHLEPEYGD